MEYKNECMGLLFPLLVLAACDNSTTIVQPMEESALRLLAVDMGNPPEKRAVITDAALTKIRLYATEQTDGHAVYAGGEGSNAEGYADYTRSGSSWTLADETKKIVIGTTAPVIHAFYPPALTVANAGNNTHTITATLLSADDFTGSGQTDYLYATTVSLPKDTKTVALAMNHAMAKVSLRIEKAQGIASETMKLAKVEILSKSNALLTGTGAMSLDDGSFSSLAGTGSITLQGTEAIELKYPQSTPNVTCLAAPVSLAASDLSFRLTLQGHEGTPFVTALFPKSQQWKAGTHYLYSITVDKISAGFSGMKVYDWQSDANQNTSIGI